MGLSLVINNTLDSHHGPLLMKALPPFCIRPREATGGSGALTGKEWLLRWLLLIF